MIDFSSKKDILILNDDGTYSRMDEPYFKAKSIKSHIWQIESSGDYSYLIEGEDEAIAIDTGYGAGNIREYMQTLTKKPVKYVINTHSHFDHTANNGYFEKAYMSTKALEKATIPYASFEGIDFIQDYTRVGIKEGYIFDLGNKELEIFEIGNHCEDSIAILDRHDRLLVTGDEFMTHSMMVNTSITQVYANILKLEEYRDDFDILLAGGGVLDASLLDHYQQCFEYILKGNIGDPINNNHHMKPLDKKDGHIVYMRRLPHYGDGGMAIPETRQLNEVTYANVRVVFEAKDVESFVKVKEDPKYYARICECFYRGHNHFPINHELAAKYALKGYEKGIGRCATILGLVSNNPTWFKEGVKLNDSKAYRHLGLYYQKIHDDKNAFEMFTLASEHGDITGQCLLGNEYEKQGDYDKAIEYYQISAQRGDEIAAPAMLCLSKLYSKLGQDDLAQEWLNRYNTAKEIVLHP